MKRGLMALEKVAVMWPMLIVLNSPRAAKSTEGILEVSREVARQIRTKLYNCVLPIEKDGGLETEKSGSGERRKRH